mgnify:CR=1 FL=1
MIITHCSVHLLTSWRIFTGEIDCIYDIWYSSVAAGLLAGCRHDNAVDIGEFLTKLWPVELAFSCAGGGVDAEGEPRAVGRRDGQQGQGALGLGLAAHARLQGGQRLRAPAGQHDHGVSARRCEGRRDEPGPDGLLRHVAGGHGLRRQARACRAPDHPETLHGLLEDKEALTAVLLRHVVPEAALKVRFHLSFAYEKMSLPSLSHGHAWGLDSSYHLSKYTFRVLDQIRSTYLFEDST